MNASHWVHSSDALPALREGVVHLWRLLADGERDTASALWPLLTEDERVRADAVRTDLGRTRFILTRGTLRRLLSLYEPGAAGTPFRYGGKGKPWLPGSALHFSVSHAGEHVLYALALVPLGVDVERLGPRGHAAAIARKLFPTAVQQALLALPERARERAFLQAWTQREAGVKALGLSVYDRSQELPFDLGQDDGILTSAAGGRHWSLLRVDAWPDTIAALAVPGTVQDVLRFDARALP